MKVGPTVVRGILSLPRSLDPSIPRSLLDISGRAVMSLRPGPNDVSRLAAGVYFCRMTARSASCARASAVAKVVVSR